MPSSAVLLPTMSLLIMPWTSVPAAFICAAMNVRPEEPLLLAGHGGEDDRRFRLAGGGQDAGQLHDHGDS